MTAMQRINELAVRYGKGDDPSVGGMMVVAWNAAIEESAKTAINNGDMLEIHSSRIAEAICKLKA